VSETEDTNYVAQADLSGPTHAFAELDAQWRELGVDPADLEVSVTYGIFNDPQVWEPLFARGEQPEALRQALLETPLYEDESASRALAHARLTNDDRRAQGKLDRYGMVLVKRQVTLKSRWITDVED
jgi:hypothetical protein